MPHFISKDIPLGSIPFEHKGYSFLGTFYDIKHANKGIIKVKYQNMHFMLAFFKKQDDTYLVKKDKSSYIFPIAIIKKALSILQNLSKNVQYSNLNFKNIPITKSKCVKSLSFFKNDYGYIKPTYIEVGFGSGRHILDFANKNPHSNIIGTEIHTPSIEQVNRQVNIHSLGNIYVLPFSIAYLLEVIKSNSIEAIFVHFPIPWDKKEHLRVINKSFLQESLRVLKKHGTLEIRTDSINYLTYCTKLLDSLKLKYEYFKNKDLPIISKYEARWRRDKKDIFDIKIMANTISHNTNLNKFYFNFFTLKRLDFLDMFENKRFYKKDNCFINIKNIYYDNKETYIIGLVMGTNLNKEQKYVIIKSTLITYFTEPLPILSNICAHNLLKGLF